MYENLNPKDTGLGNTLFQLAAQYAFSKKYSLKMNVHELDIYCNKLNRCGYDHDKTILRKFLENYDSSLIEDFMLLSEEQNKEQICDKNIIKVVSNSSNSNIKLYGYLQSHVYFDECRDDLINMFEIDDKSMEYIKTSYPRLFDENFVCISLHVRMNYCGIDYNFNYFKKAIEYFTEKYANTNKQLCFFVFSNNIDSIKEWFRGKNDILYRIVNNPVDYLDLWTMSLCKHNIISHSTFSWWGAYLNKNSDKIVLYPNDALRIFWGKLYNDPQCIERKWEHYKPEWIGLEVNTF
jgi:hypothetical protein